MDKPNFPEWPVFDEEEVEAAKNVVKSGLWWCGAPQGHAGENVWKFQEEFAKLQEARHCVAVFNGTVAIETALAAMGVGLGDEVIVSDWTFVASASAVMALHAVPIFCDVDPETFVLDVTKLEGLITPRTKAIVSVHLGGNPVAMDHLMEIAEKHNLRVVEDCAHAHGSRFKGKRVGNWGDAGTFSFQASKVLTAGEGGAIVCNNDDLADKLYGYSDCGRHKGQWFYSHYEYGTNYRLSEWQAAILRPQLKKFPAQHARRNENAATLQGLLNEIDGIRCMKPTPGTDELGWYVFPFIYEPAKFQDLSYKEFYAKLNAQGIPTDDCYPPLHKVECFRDMRGRKGVDYSHGNWGGTKSDDMNFPVVSDLHSRSVELPQELLLADNRAFEYVRDVVNTLRG